MVLLDPPLALFRSPPAFRRVRVSVTARPSEVETDSVVIKSGAVDTALPRESVVVMNWREVSVDSDAEVVEEEEGVTTTVVVGGTEVPVDEAEEGACEAFETVRVVVTWEVGAAVDEEGA